VVILLSRIKTQTRLSPGLKASMKPKKRTQPAPIVTAEYVEDCGSQRRAASEAIRAREIKRVFPSRAKREAFVQARIDLIRPL